MKKGRQGFTLLELVVSAALVAGAAMVVVGAFAAGLRVFERVRRVGVAEEALVAMEIVQRDLRNAAPFRLAGFRGTATWMEIPAVVKRTDPADPGDYLGTLRYEVGAQGRGLDRVTSVYIRPGEIEETREQVAALLDRWTLAFAPTGSLSWTDTWSDPTNLPAAVRMAWVVSRGGEAFEIERTVSLPRQE